MQPGSHFRSLVSLAAVALFFVLAGSAHEPARFLDANRAARIRALAPEIEGAYRNFAVTNKIPGIAWGIVLDGQLILSGAHGYSQLDSKTPATTKTLFRIASMSKSFTAMAILHLRDAGKLRLDDPAEAFIPELKDIPPLSKDSPKITIRDLLIHSAGFPEDNPWGDWQLEDSDTDLTKLLRRGLSFSNPPGVAYEYSNLGYTLLGRIVSRISGVSCQSYIEQHLLVPLGMNHTQWEYTKVPPQLLAHGFRWEEQQWKSEKLLHDGVFGPMGGMISSIEDFSKYIALHLSAWPPRDSANSGPIQRASLREMHQPGRISGFNTENINPNGTPCPIVSGYAFGLGWTRDCHDQIALGHSGGLPGFGSNWRILPELGLGIVTLANRTYAPASVLNTTILQVILDKAKLQPRVLPPSPILQQRKIELLKFLPDWTNATNSPIFAENFFGDQSVELRRRHTRELFDQAGNIQRVGDLQPLNNLRGTFLLHGARSSLEIQFTLSPENPPLIQQFKARTVPRSD
jgi:CubicO group peptidase (beta-lactamase class C family)